MTDQTVHFYTAPEGQYSRPAENEVRIEPATCTEAESFVLRVLDDSMQPEFRRGCMIVIDPTGRATDGSFVLARQPAEVESGDSEAIDGFLFRQLVKDAAGGWVLKPLNEQYQAETLTVTLDAVVGVIVQRAGTRRSYHKRYD